MKKHRLRKCTRCGFTSEFRVGRHESIYDSATWTTKPCGGLMALVKRPNKQPRDRHESRVAHAIRRAQRRIAVERKYANACAGMW